MSGAERGPADDRLLPRLRDGATFKVVGLGGVGSVVARYLARFLASQRASTRLVLVDGDRFEPTNETRMFFLEEGNKAEVVRDELLPYVEGARLEVSAVPEYVDPDNLERLIAEGDVVLLCVDNDATRKLVNDFCRERRRNVCLISGGNDGVVERRASSAAVGEGAGEKGRDRGTYGSVQIYVREEGEDRTPHLAAQHREVAEPEDELPGDDCLRLAASVPQILFANLMTASAVLNAAWLFLCGRLHYYEAGFDVAEARMSPLPIPRGRRDAPPTAQPCA